jgi:hypothetical protein
MQESHNRTCQLTIVGTLVERRILPGTDDLQEEVLKVSKIKHLFSIFLCVIAPIFIPGQKKKFKFIL